MRNVWLIVPFALLAALSGETWAQADRDLYIDSTESSGNYPVDDDDYSSGSGSGIPARGDDEDENVVLTTVQTLISSPSSEMPYVETTTLKTLTKMAPETKEPGEVESTNTVLVYGKKDIVQTATHTENLFHRTEVLAAVIAGGGIGFLFAVFLILLLVYRMRKKDEGSYDLGEGKPSRAVYQKAPTKEFYA
nr:syndecan-2 [Xenopus laevis]